MRARDLRKIHSETRRKAEHPGNTFDSIRTIVEQVSNVTDESDLQLQKHDSHKISTDDGIIIDFNPLRPNADFLMR
jgi:hypothetical protein